MLKDSWFGRKIILMAVTRGPIVEAKQRWKGNVQLGDCGAVSRIAPEKALVSRDGDLRAT